MARSTFRRSFPNLRSTIFPVGRFSNGNAASRAASKAQERERPSSAAISSRRRRLHLTISPAEAPINPRYARFSASPDSRPGKHVVWASRRARGFLFFLIPQFPKKLHRCRTMTCVVIVRKRKYFHISGDKFSKKFHPVRHFWPPVDDRLFPGFRLLLDSLAVA